MSSFAKQLFKKHKITTYFNSFKKNNLYEAMALEPKYGSGEFFAPKHWAKEGKENDYYRVTRHKLKPDLKHGKAWGDFFKNGVLKRVSRRIPDPLKHEWCRYDNVKSKTVQE